MPFEIMKPLETVTVDKQGHNLVVSLLVKIQHSSSPGVQVFEKTVQSKINPKGRTAEEIKAFVKSDLKAKALAVKDAAIAEKARLAELAVVQIEVQTYVEAEI